MGTYRVETEDGVYEVEVDDGASQKDAILPNVDQTEQKINGREDILGGLMKDVQAGKTTDLIQNPLQSAPLRLMGGLAQRTESAIANPLIELQKGNPSGMLDQFLKGASGERKGQLGDLVRNTGVGGDYNEALASTTGFLAALSIPDILTAGKVGKSVESSAKKGALKIPEAIDSTKQAVADAVTNKTGFLDDVRSAFYDAKSKAVDKYGEGLENLAKDNPDKVVSLRPVVDQLNAEMAYEPKLRNAINRVPYLKQIFDKPELADGVGIQEAQKLVNDLQSRVSSGKLKGVGVRPDDIPLLDAIHDIKGQMLEAFPDIKNLRKDYGELINNFNIVRNKLKPGNLQKAVKENFGDIEIENAAKKVLDGSPEIISRMKNYNLLRKFGVAATSAVGGAVGYKAIENYIKNFSR